METGEAIAYLRSLPEFRPLIEELFLDEDVELAARRFADSGEFAEVREILRMDVPGALILDLGAGTGVASAALADAGARLVLSVEPNDGDVVGLGCLRRLQSGRQIVPIGAMGERLPIRDEVVDIVFCRQVLHHMTKLDEAIGECARVLKPGGRLIACREHVVDNERQLARFLAEHPVHQLAGGEHAYALGDYRNAFIMAGLRLDLELGPWDSVINAYPTVLRQEDIQRAPQIVLGQRLGRIGRLLGGLPGSRQLAWMRLRRRKPGRLFSFIATKP